MGKQVRLTALILCSVVFVISGCSNRQGSVEHAPAASSGGFFGGDRPPASVPKNIDQIPDAVPVYLPLSKTGNKPYTVFGRSYVPMQTAEGFEQTGIASWYGEKFQGRRTSSGEPYEMFAMTAAHPTLPLPSFVEVTNLENGRKVTVKVNDRGPFLHNRVLDLSYAAAHRLRFADRGTARIRLRVISVNRVQQANTARPTKAPDSSRVGPRHVLQIGAYNSWHNAQNLRQLLKLSGFRLHPEQDDDLQALGPPFRVQVGPYASADERNQQQSRLERMVGHPVARKVVTLP
ncbi:MAG: septal ring lytic transglycosylase RlpA family protein [Pseudomonadota bacterium]